MIELLDIVSRGRPEMHPHNIPFGQAIDATNNVRNILHKVGIKGTHHKRQAKQVICCSVMNIDAHRCLRNRKLLKSLLPHKDDHCRRQWINHCVSYLNDYNDGKRDVFFNKYEDQHRDI